MLQISGIQRKTSKDERTKMKKIMHTMRIALCAGWLLTGSMAWAGDAKTYQVSGPVLEVTPTTITVQKGSEK
jgi:hypothetical protein